MREIQTSTTHKILEVFKFIFLKVFSTSFLKPLEGLGWKCFFTIFTRMFLRVRQFVLKTRNIEN